MRKKNVKVYEDIEGVELKGRRTREIYWDSGQRFVKVKVRRMTKKEMERFANENNDDVS